MTKDQLAYCTGCDYLSKSGEASCDYISYTGISRGCPVGEGCPYHTGKADAERRKHEEGEALKMFEAGAADSEIAATIGWTLSQVRHWRQKAGLKKAPGWNMSSGRTKPHGGRRKKTNDTEPPVETVERQTEPQKEPKTEEPSSGITFQEFMLTLDQLIPEKLHDAAFYIDGKQVKSLYGYSVTMPGGKLTVDLLTVR